MDVPDWKSDYALCLQEKVFLFCALDACVGRFLHAFVP